MKSQEAQYETERTEWEERQKILETEHATEKMRNNRLEFQKKEVQKDVEKLETKTKKLEAKLKTLHEECSVNSAGNTWLKNKNSNLKSELN